MQADTAAVACCLLAPEILRCICQFQDGVDAYVVPLLEFHNEKRWTRLLHILPRIADVDDVLGPWYDLYGTRHVLDVLRLMPRLAVLLSTHALLLGNAEVVQLMDEHDYLDRNDPHHLFLAACNGQLDVVALLTEKNYAMTADKMLGTLKNRMVESGKQLKSTLEEQSAEMNQRLQMMNINVNAERLTAVASSVVTSVAKTTAGTIAATSSPPSSTTNLGSKEPDEVAGGPFFASFVHRQQQVLLGHHALVQSGENLSQVLAQTRRRVTAEAQSVMYLQHNFQSITSIRDNIRSMRDSIQSLVVLMEDVEQLLMTKTEEHLVAENARFALQQQAELEQYEHNALVEKHARMQKRHEARQRALGEAFAKDLQAYHTIVTYQGQLPRSDAPVEPVIPLESIEIAIQPDTDLEAFYKEDVEEDIVVVETQVLAPDDDEETKEEAKEETKEVGDETKEETKEDGQEPVCLNDGAKENEEAKAASNSTTPGEDDKAAAAVPTLRLDGSDNEE
ncbi:unnamed protein product [Aphanomyces euteiches]